MRAEAEQGPVGLLGTEAFLPLISCRQESSLHDLRIPKGTTVAHQERSRQETTCSVATSCLTLCDPLEKTLMLGKIEGSRRGDDRG